uniref:G-protein coupled receptors family 1 profile domain-containing protein n=2 Tax=Ascaris TaxID=6251 RepID=A0A9J2PQ15_ASCLU
MNEEYRCILCAELAHTIGFNILLGVMSCISLLAIVAEIYSMKRTTINITVHSNTRILILAHQIVLILHCLARLHAHISDLYLFTRSYTNPCDYLSTATRCFFLRTPITWTFFMSACSVSGIVAERTIATFFSAKYERMGKSVSVLLISMEILVTSLLFFLVVYDVNMLGSTKVAVYCASLNEDNAKSSIGVLSFLFGVDVASAFLLPILLCINKKSRKNEIHTNLSHRYQMSENIASIRTLLPLLFFHSIVYAIFISAILIYFLTQQEWSQRAYAIFLESVQLSPVYALLLPVMLRYTQRRVQKRQMETLNSVMGFTKKEATDLYFETFQRLPKPKARHQNDTNKKRRYDGAKQCVKMN